MTIIGNHVALARPVQFGTQQRYTEAHYLPLFAPGDRQKIAQNRAAYAQAVHTATPPVKEALDRVIDMYGSADIEGAAAAEGAICRLDARFAVGGQFYENRLMATLLKKQQQP